MAKGRKRGRSMYKETDVEVEIGYDDIIEYIDDYASEDELLDIAQAVVDAGVSNLATDGLFEDRGMDGGYIRREKLELLSQVYHKFSLSELEERLGTKFNLK
jgi:hypothetical protein